MDDEFNLLSFELS